ncbi:MAG: hypothetical protein ABMB14_15155 [Myxococcota bacterium]
MDGQENPDCQSVGSIEVEVGTGTAGFEPVADGGPVSFFQGPQGGYHVFVSLRAVGIDPGDAADPFGPDSPTVTLSVTADGDVVGQIADQPRLFEDGPDGALLIGEQVVLEVLDPPSLDGAAATLSGEVTDRCGRTGANERAVRLALASLR